MANIPKVDKERAKAVMAQADRLSSRVELMSLPTTNEAQAALASDVLTLRKVATVALLHTMRTQLLEPLDVASARALERSYPSLVELLRADHVAISSLVGKDEAAKALHKATTVRDTVLDQVPCTLNREKWPTTCSKLIRDAVTCDRLIPLQLRISGAIEAVQSLQTDLEPIKPATTFTGSVLLPKKQRDAIVAAIDDIESRLLTIGGAIVGIECDVSALAELSNEEAWEAYEADRNRYDEVIERASGVRPSDDLLFATGDRALEGFHLVRRLHTTLCLVEETALIDEVHENEKLEKLVREQREHDAKQRLRGIDIDVLANGGAKIGPFKTAGFTNLGQLYGETPYSLSRLQRITWSTAAGVLRAVEEVYKSAYEQTRCTLDAETKPIEQNELIEEMFRSRLLSPLRVEKQSLSGELNSLRNIAVFAGVDTDYIDTLVLPSEKMLRFTQAVETLDAKMSELEKRAQNLFRDYNYADNITASEAWSDFEQNAAAYYARLEQLGGGSAEISVGDLPASLVDEVSSLALDTSMMKSTLRRYQRFCVQYALHQERTLIGDEMGLGKTVEAIAVMAHLAARGEKHFVVVCPLSVLVNWTREVPVHSTLRAYGVYGKYRDEEFQLWQLHGGVAVTTYETAQRLEWKQLRAGSIGIVVVDEAHYIKNPQAKRTIALARNVLPLSERAMFLTGTPLENRVEEMNNLLFMLNPGLVLEKLSHDHALCNPIEYRTAIAPVYLRRKREDVLEELPKKIEKWDWCSLSSADKQDYILALYEGNFSSMRRVGWRHGKLQQSAKATRLKEVCDEAKANGSKVLVFSYFLDTLNKVERICGKDCAGIINGRVPAAQRQELVDEFSRSDKTVLVSQVTAGGVGLNIQAASIVIFCEPQIKPSMEEQAISRAYRMGQVRTVVVHHLLMSDTVDERVEEILSQKRAEFKAFADLSQTGQESLGVIDSGAIIEIIEAERKRYNIQDGKPITTSSNSGDGQ